jgi:hypothetical protein
VTKLYRRGKAITAEELATLADAQPTPVFQQADEAKRKWMEYMARTAPMGGGGPATRRTGDARNETNKQWTRKDRVKRKD